MLSFLKFYFAVLVLTSSFVFADLKSFNTSELVNPAGLNKKFFLQTNKHLSSEEFEGKFQVAVSESPLALFRSFASTYYADLKNLSSVGPIGICFGDLHPDNFGFMEMKEGIKFLFNDFDDTGYCPVSIDVLRYFTSLRLSDLKSQDGKFNSYIRDYVEQLKSPQSHFEIPQNKLQDPTKHQKKELEKYTEDDVFVFDRGYKELEELSKKEKRHVEEALAFFPDLTILDVASYTKESGGSGALKRYWLLTKNSRKKREILELKPFIEPATDQGQWGHEPDPRLEWAVNEIWKGYSPIFYTTIFIDHNEYLFRSRTFKNLNFEKETPKEKSFWIRAEISELASQHSPYWGNASREDLENLSQWLEEGSKIIARRFTEIYENTKKQK